jgi:hypothetical protein
LICLNQVKEEAKAQRLLRLSYLAGMMKTMTVRDGVERDGNEDLERELTRAIRQAAPDVVRNVILKANEGSYLHAKFLFELAGLDLAKSGPGPGHESLAGFLLKELRESAGQSTELRREG